MTEEPTPGPVQPTGEDRCARCREQVAVEVLDGIPTCRRCGMLVRLKSEIPRSCPVDGTVMEKEVVETLLIDRCGTCGGVWLDHDELEILLRLTAERNDGTFLNGVLLKLAW